MLASRTNLEHLKHYYLKEVLLFWVAIIFMCNGLHYNDNIFKVCKEVGDNHKIDLDPTFP